MRARFQSDMSADSEKICDRFTDFPASRPILQPKCTYPFAKWRTLKVNLLGNKGRLIKRRSTFLYHSGRNIPAFLTKLIPTTKTKTNGTLLGNKLQTSLSQVFSNFNIVALRVIPPRDKKRLKSLICNYSKFQSSCLSSSYFSTIIFQQRTTCRRSWKTCAHILGRSMARSWSPNRARARAL